MNNLICDKKKKPLKSYDFKGFNSICFPAGGERGTRTSFFSSLHTLLKPFKYAVKYKNLINLNVIAIKLMIYKYIKCGDYVGIIIIFVGY